MMRTFAHRHAHARATSSPGRVLSDRGLRRASGQTAEIRHILGRGAVQPKLTVSEPNDALEQEADRVAEEVMRMEAPEPGPKMRTHASPPAVQRACSGCGEATEELVQREAEDEEELLQAKRSAGQRGVVPSFPGLARPMLKSGCACGGGCPSCRAAPAVPVDHRLEREAGQVTDRVVREAAPARAPPAQAARGDAHDQAEEQAAADLPRLRAAHAGGEPLPAELRAFYEPRFGRDLSEVRLHHGLAAGASACALGARAYTLGRDIAFAPGELRPRSIEGRRLIAHELAHVVQQGRAPPTLTSSVRPLPRISPLRNGRRIQRKCGPSEIGTVTGCQREIGDIFGTPILFDVNCDTLTPDGEAMLAEIGEDVRGMSVDVHGFASAEGDPDFNFSLSCLRAYTIAIRLTDEYDVYLNQAYEHGATPGEQTQRRSVCIRPLGLHEQEPEPIRVPAHEPAPSLPVFPADCAPAVPREVAPDCIPNPHGSDLPPVGSTHEETHAPAPCVLPESVVAASPDWCVDRQQAHGGEACYRQIPAVAGAPGDQYCYSENCCHNSTDQVSVVDPNSPGSGACCENADWETMGGHIWEDVVPELVDDPIRVIRDTLGI